MIAPKFHSHIGSLAIYGFVAFLFSLAFYTRECTDHNSGGRSGVPTLAIDTWVGLPQWFFYSSVSSKNREAHEFAKKHPPSMRIAPSKLVISLSLCLLVGAVVHCLSLQAARLPRPNPGNRLVAYYAFIVLVALATGALGTTLASVDVPRSFVLSVFVPLVFIPPLITFAWFSWRLSSYIDVLLGALAMTIAFWWSIRIADHFQLPPVEYEMPTSNDLFAMGTGMVALLLISFPVVLFGRFKAATKRTTPNEV